MTLNPSPGHAPALPGLTRRSLLRASPALLAPALLAAPALASTADTPIKAIYRVWNAARDRCRERNAALAAQGIWLRPGPIHEDERIAGAALMAVEDEPITSVEDALLKTMIITGYLSGPHYKLSAELRTFLREAV